MAFHDEHPFGDNHIAHRKEYADAAARTGASGLTAADIGTIARQLDDGSVWWLKDNSPLTWKQIDGSSSTDEKVKADATDGVAGLLIEKLMAGDGVVLKVKTPAIIAPVAQYLLNEASSGQGPTNALDNMGTPFNLLHDYSTTPLQPEYFSGANGKGLEWITTADAGGPHSSIVGTKIVTQIDGNVVASLCTVIDIDSVTGAGVRFFHIGETTSDGAFSLMASDSAEISFSFNNKIAKFALAVTSGRYVIHAVFDSAQIKSEDRLRVYADGTRLEYNSGPLPSASETLDLSHASARMFIGNRDGNVRSPDGKISYCSIFDGAVSQDQITMEASALAANDDADPTPSLTGKAVEIQAPGIDHSKRYRRGFLAKSTSTSQLEIGIGSCRDSTDALNLELTAAATVDISTSGAGGLDTGSEAANTWYAIYVIGDTDGVNAEKGMLSLSQTAPTMPSGYDVFRHVGWARNDASSNLKKFRYHTEQYCHYNTDRTDQTALSAGSATSFAAVDCAAFVPPTANLAEISIKWDPNATTSSAQMRPGGFGSTTDQINIRSAEVSSSSYDYPPFQAALDDVQELDYIVSSSLDDLSIYVHGFYDDIY